MTRDDLGWESKAFAGGKAAYVLKVGGTRVGEVQPVIGGRRELDEPSGWVWMTHQHEEFGIAHLFTGDTGGVYGSLEDAQLALRTYVEGCLVVRGLLPALVEETDGEVEAVEEDTADGTDDAVSDHLAIDEGAETGVGPDEAGATDGVSASDEVSPE